MGECDELVGLLLESLLDLLQRGALADGGGEVCDVGSVGLEALAEGIAEVAGVEDEGVLATLDQVGGDKIPSEGSATGDDEGLRGRVGGLEELAGESQGLAEDLDEAGSDMALTAGWLVDRHWMIAQLCSDSRVVGHRLENGIVELDGSWDQEGVVRGLDRHIGSWFGKRGRRNGAIDGFIFDVVRN